MLNLRRYRTAAALMPSIVPPLGTSGATYLRSPRAEALRAYKGRPAAKPAAKPAVKAEPPKPAAPTPAEPPEPAEEAGSGKEAGK